MEALEIFKKQLQTDFVPSVPSEKNRVGTLQSTCIKVVPSVPSKNIKDVGKKNKIQIYDYQITDNPKSLLTVIMPGTDLAGAEQILMDKYGDRLLKVVEH